MLVGPPLEGTRRSSSRPHKLPAAGVLFALAVALVLACNSNADEEEDNQFREDVIWCEEAVARLERCCPGFDATRVECTFYFSRHEGCGATDIKHVEPAFTTEESHCIRETACARLVETGVCERAAQSGAARSTFTSVSTSSTSSGASGTSSTSGSPPRPTVCP